MIILIAAATIAAAQPAPAPVQGHDMSMTHEQHDAMKEKCCCDDMEKGAHDQHASSDRPRDQRGE